MIRKRDQFVIPEWEKEDEEEKDEIDSVLTTSLQKNLRSVLEP